MEEQSAEAQADPAGSFTSSLPTPLALFLCRLCHNRVSDRSWNWRDGTSVTGGIGKCRQGMLKPDWSS